MIISELKATISDFKDKALFIMITEIIAETNY